MEINKLSRRVSVVCGMLVFTGVLGLCFTVSFILCELYSGRDAYAGTKKDKTGYIESENSSRVIWKNDAPIKINKVVCIGGNGGVIAASSKHRSRMTVIGVKVKQIDDGTKFGKSLIVQDYIAEGCLPDGFYPGTPIYLGENGDLVRKRNVCRTCGFVLIGYALAGGDLFVSIQHMFR